MGEYRRQRRDDDHSNDWSRSSESKELSPLARARYNPRYDEPYDPRYDRSLRWSGEKPSELTESEERELLEAPGQGLEALNQLLGIAPNENSVDSSAKNQAQEENQESNPVLDFLNYLWGTLIGDWNNQSDPLQDVVNMGGGLIPIVDQVLDVRDFAAHAYYMVFKKDYDNSMRWLALGLTAIGAVPVVGSVVKGLGKLAIFQGGIEVIAKNAQPLLDAIRKINPEWADIGKLKGAIDSGWSDGVATSKGLWQQLLGSLKIQVESIPTPPGCNRSFPPLKKPEIEAK